MDLENEEDHMINWLRKERKSKGDSETKARARKDGKKLVIDSDVSSDGAGNKRRVRKSKYDSPNSGSPSTAKRPRQTAPK